MWLGQQHCHDRCSQPWLLAENCDACTVSVTFIAGYYMYILQLLVKCCECKAAVCHSEQDTYSDITSLTYFKDCHRETTEKELSVPSGSVYQPLFLCKKVFGHSGMTTWFYEEKLLIEVLTETDVSTIFPFFSAPASGTADGIDHHHVGLIYLIF